MTRTSSALRALRLLLLALSAMPAFASCDETGPAPASLCEPGTLGCECASGDVCGADARGEALRCVDDACVPSTCESGAMGCVCRAGRLCDDAAAACTAGVCKPAECRAGDLHCDCLAGTCGPGLYCDESFGGGTCVDDAGFPGGECLSNSLCHQQSRCDHSTETCVRCELGSQGCAPDRGQCNSGLVYAAGRCLPPNEVPPDAPRCYTRCSDDVVTANAVLTCDSNGFIAGCMPGLDCVEGTCLPPGDVRVSCSDDHGCPEFQSCLSDGHCYSNCDATTDCPSGLACHHHVCRMPCDANAIASQACPEDMRCDAEDGQAGHCMPIAPGSDDLADQSKVTATFEVAPTSIALDALATTGEVTIRHQSLVSERFEIRKLRHRAFDRSGAIVADPRGEPSSADYDPLPFVTLSVPGAQALPDGGSALSVSPSCGAGCPKVTIRVTQPVPDEWARWEGDVEIRHASMGAQTVRLAFQAAVDGRWVGTMYYFASFPDPTNLDTWRASSNKIDASYVGNGLIRQWATFRNGRLEGYREMEAILGSTSRGSWKWPSIQSACAPIGSNDTGACYPYDGEDGGDSSSIRRYVNDLEATPIPSGVTEFPIALNLRAAGDTSFVGVVDSAASLHYPGNPTVSMAFATPPADSARCAANLDGIRRNCVTFLTAFDAEITVGGRRRPASNHTCPAGFDLVSTPWLVPGFDGGSAGGVREECRESRVPFAAGDPRNANLTVGNPIADGHSIRRKISLVDGAMVDQEHLVVIFEEELTTSVRAGSVSAYGYMLLERSAQPLLAAEMQSEVSGTSSSGSTGVERGRASCAPIAARLSVPLPTDPAARASLMLNGNPQNQTAITDGIHYFCADTGLVDGGPRNVGGGGANDVSIPCPPESNVRFFALPAGTFSQTAIANLPCQQQGSCAAQLDTWIRSTQTITPDLSWSCVDDVPYCSGNRNDLRAGKRFFAPSGPRVFPPLESAIEEAFRYKTRFRATRGSSVGFAPTPCVGNGSITPYCYDADAIEEITERIDCILASYADDPTHWSEEKWSDAREFLATSLSVHPVGQSGPQGDGFERLNAELLIMLGDDAMTRALSSRFDLASVNGASFYGAQFEVGGINLSGIAGYEMRQLYQAVQYYDLATERFFTTVAPSLFDAIARGDVGQGDQLVSQEVVSTYLERLIGGSTKKAAAWSQVAQRYQSFDRADLARAVLRRAYMGTYLESLVLSRLMLDVADASDATNRTQVVAILEDAQARYRVAMASMRESYGKISQDGERFGFSPDDIPFPAVDDTDTRFANAFEAVLGLARLRTDTARRFEDDAILGSRSFETDTAAFEAELVQISVQHENRLAQICGTFRGRDGLAYPAISKYSHLSDRTMAMGDPCGMVGNGELTTSISGLGISAAEVDEFVRRKDHLIDRLDLEDERVASQCSRLGSLRDLQVGEMENRRSIQTSIDRMENEISTAQRMVGHVAQLANLASCSIFDCPGVGVKMAAYTYAAALSEAVILDDQDRIVDSKSSMMESQIREFRAQIDSECASLQIDSVPVVAQIHEEIEQTTYDVMQATRRVGIALDGIGALRLEAQRVEQQQQDAEQMAINVAAARNDPNVRVYMNTAMLNADRSFNRALEHAYRATRLLEYFTSQSYAYADELYLIRMVSRGEHNLDSYLDALEDAYESFRVQYRTRSQRAVRLSMMDDILRIPFQSETGVALTTSQRTEMMRQRLLEPSRLDAHGRRTIEFRTELDQFSPCTFGHQINYVEIAFAGADLGDLNANVMLWQDGTGVVQRPDGGQNFHRLPPALIVATPRLNRDTTFDPSIFKNFGMRERPLVNTAWRLVFDQTSPQNRDVSISQISDIYVYLYYSDFTNPDACR